MDTLNKNNILRSVDWPALSNENEQQKTDPFIPNVAVKICGSWSHETPLDTLGRERVRGDPTRDRMQIIPFYTRGQDWVRGFEDSGFFFFTSTFLRSYTHDWLQIFVKREFLLSRSRALQREN